MMDVLVVYKSIMVENRNLIVMIICEKSHRQLDWIGTLERFEEIMIE
jgi:hypothetical protein